MKKGGIFLLLLAFLCVGQGFGPKIVKGPTPSSPSGPGMDPNDPSTIPGLAWRWVASDLLTVNLQTNQPVTNWVDRIQASRWTNGDSATRPTNTASSGVGFDGNTWLTNVGISASTWPLSSFIVIKRTDAAGINGYLSRKSDSHGYLLDHAILNGASHWVYNKAALGALAGALPDNAWMDLVVDDGRVDATDATFYTNRVLSSSIVVGNWEEQSFDTLGAYSIAGNRMKGFIQELCIWTNRLTSGNVITLHSYRTNVYGGSP